MSVLNFLQLSISLYPCMALSLVHVSYYGYINNSCHQQEKEDNVGKYLQPFSLVPGACLSFAMLTVKLS